MISTLCPVIVTVCRSVFVEHGVRDAPVRGQRQRRAALKVRERQLRAPARLESPHRPSISVLELANVLRRARALDRQRERTGDARGELERRSALPRRRVRRLQERQSMPRRLPSASACSATSTWPFPSRLTPDTDAPPRDGRWPGAVLPAPGAEGKQQPGRSVHSMTGARQPSGTGAARAPTGSGRRRGDRARSDVAPRPRPRRAGRATPPARSGCERSAPHTRPARRTRPAGPPPRQAGAPPPARRPSPRPRRGHR